MGIHAYDLQKKIAAPFDADYRNCRRYTIICLKNVLACLLMSGLSEMQLLVTTPNAIINRKGQDRKQTDMGIPGHELDKLRAHKG